MREPRANPRFTLWGLILAREFGDTAIYDKLEAHCEAHHEPTWDTAAGEFTWGFGLNEPHPRGQFNATRMMAEALSEGSWRRLFNAPNLGKLDEPTVYGVDFPDRLPLASLVRCRPRATRHRHRRRPAPCRRAADVFPGCQHRPRCVPSRNRRPPRV